MKLPVTFSTALDVTEDVEKKRLSRARERMRASVEAAFGAALIATAPTPDFAVRVLGLSSPSKVLSYFRALAKFRSVTIPIRLAGLTAAVVVIVSTPQFRTWWSSSAVYSSSPIAAPFEVAALSAE